MNNEERARMRFTTRAAGAALLTLTVLLGGCQAPGYQSAQGTGQVPLTVSTVEFFVAQTAPAPGLMMQTLPGGTVYLPSQPVLTRGDLTEAAAVRDQQGRHFVALRFSESGAHKLNEVSMRNVGKPLAVVIDGRMVAAPRIAEPLNHGVLAFSVDSAATATAMAARIRGD